VSHLPQQPREKKTSGRYHNRCQWTSVGEAINEIFGVCCIKRNAQRNATKRKTSMQGKATNLFYQPGPSSGHHIDRLARCRSRVRSARALLACVALAKPKSSRSLTLAFAVGLGCGVLPTCLSGFRVSLCRNAKPSFWPSFRRLNILRSYVGGPLKDGDFSYSAALRAFES